MQDPVSLQEPFTYSTTIIYILLVIIVLLIISLFIKKREKKVQKVEVKLVHAPNLFVIKKTYLDKIDDLLKRVKSNNISNRKGYHELSKIIRGFVFETTNINVLSLSLKEVSNYNIPYLKDLMEEYYSPEFSRVSTSDITASIEKTREVINRWR